MPRIGRNASFFKAVHDEAMALPHSARLIITEGFEIARRFERLGSLESLGHANQALDAVRELVRGPKLKKRIDGRVKLNNDRIAILEARRNLADQTGSG